MAEELPGDENFTLGEHNYANERNSSYSTEDCSFEEQVFSHGQTNGSFEMESYEIYEQSANQVNKDLEDEHIIPNILAGDTPITSNSNESPDDSLAIFSSITRSDVGQYYIKSSFVRPQLTGAHRRDRFTSTIHATTLDNSDPNPLNSNTVHLSPSKPPSFEEKTEQHDTAYGVKPMSARQIRIASFRGSGNRASLGSQNSFSCLPSPLKISSTPSSASASPLSPSSQRLMMITGSPAGRRPVSPSLPLRGNINLDIDAEASDSMTDHSIDKTISESRVNLIKLSDDSRVVSFIEKLEVQHRNIQGSSLLGSEVCHIDQSAGSAGMTINQRCYVPETDIDVFIDDNRTRALGASSKVTAGRRFLEHLEAQLSEEEKKSDYSCKFGVLTAAQLDKRLGFRISLLHEVIRPPPKVPNRNRSQSISSMFSPSSTASATVTPSTTTTFSTITATAVPSLMQSQVPPPTSLLRPTNAEKELEFVRSLNINVSKPKRSSANRPVERSPKRNAAVDHLRGRGMSVKADRSPLSDISKTPPFPLRVSVLPGTDVGPSVINPSTSLRSCSKFGTPEHSVQSSSLDDNSHISPSNNNNNNKPHLISQDDGVVEAEIHNSVRSDDDIKNSVRNATANSAPSQVHNSHPSLQQRDAAGHCVTATAGESISSTSNSIETSSGNSDTTTTASTTLSCVEMSSEVTPAARLSPIVPSPTALHAPIPISIKCTSETVSGPVPLPIGTKHINSSQFPNGSRIMPKSENNCKLNDRLPVKNTVECKTRSKMCYKSSEKKSKSSSLLLTFQRVSSFFYRLLTCSRSKPQQPLVLIELHTSVSAYDRALVNANYKRTLDSEMFPFSDGRFVDDLKHKSELVHLQDLRRYSHSEDEREFNRNTSIIQKSASFNFGDHHTHGDMITTENGVAEHTMMLYGEGKNGVKMNAGSRLEPLRLFANATSSLECETGTTSTDCPAKIESLSPVSLPSNNKKLHASNDVTENINDIVIEMNREISPCRTTTATCSGSTPPSSGLRWVPNRVQAESSSSGLRNFWSPASVRVRVDPSCECESQYQCDVAIDSSGDSAVDNSRDLTRSLHAMTAKQAALHFQSRVEGSIVDHSPSSIDSDSNHNSGPTSLPTYTSTPISEDCCNSDHNLTTADEIQGDGCRQCFAQMLDGRGIDVQSLIGAEGNVICGYEDKDNETKNKKSHVLGPAAVDVDDKRRSLSVDESCWSSQVCRRESMFSPQNRPNSTNFSPGKPASNHSLEETQIHELKNTRDILIHADIERTDETFSSCAAGDVTEFSLKDSLIAPVSRERSASADMESPRRNRKSRIPRPSSKPTRVAQHDTSSTSTKISHDHDGLVLNPCINYDTENIVNQKVFK